MSAAPHSGWQLGCARRVATRHGEFDFSPARHDGSGEVAWLLTRGDVGGGEPLLARVHSSCVTSETFRGCDCDCADQLGTALARIAARGRGALFYLFQEGRGAGFLAKARDRMLVQASGQRLTTFDAYARMGLAVDTRRYEAVAALCFLAGIDAPLLLQSNNPQKVAELERSGVRVAGVEALEHGPSPFNQHYLAAKRRFGHRLARFDGAAAAAELPEEVEELVATPVPDAPGLVRHARYLLPVRASAGRGRAPLWLSLHAYHDAATGDERVVFTLGDPRRPDAVTSVQEQVLLERLALETAPAAAAWQQSLERLAAAGAGIAVFLPPGQPEASEDATTAALLAHHTGAASGAP